MSRFQIQPQHDRPALTLRSAAEPLDTVTLIVTARRPSRTTRPSAPGAPAPSMQLTPDELDASSWLDAEWQ